MLILSCYTLTHTLTHMIKYLAPSFIRVSFIILTTICISQSLHSQNMKSLKTKIPEKLPKDTEKINLEEYIKEIETRAFEYRLNKYRDIYTPEQVVKFTQEEISNLNEKEASLFASACRGYNIVIKYPSYDLRKTINPSTRRFVTSKTDHNSWVSIIKEFNDKGHLRSKYLVVDTNQRVGIGYEYDDTEKFLREVDYEEGYKFKFVDVIAYYKKIGKFQDYQNPSFRHMEYDNGKKAWRICYFEGAEYVTDIFDGESGELFHTIREARESGKPKDPNW